ncbi:MAG: major tail protein [Candidatus Merdivicinus sp.]|jgi:phi13 family phage major tail protein
MPNKVKYNLKNVHYAPQTPGEDGAIPTFGTPVPIPGAVSLSLASQGNTTIFYADGMAYYTTSSNNGYQGDLVIALIPDSFSKDILKEVEDETAKTLSEYSDVQPEEFALLFEFDGDEKAIRHVLYNCKATRPAVNGQTSTENIEPQTDSLSLTATPLPNYLVKTRTTESTPQETYDNWYKSVFMPAERTLEAEKA